MTYEKLSTPNCTRILVVEDEFLIRMMLSDELRDAGFEVIEASTADDALVILKTLKPHLIISDVRMPGTIDGMALLDFVRKMSPDLPFIISSAYFESANANFGGRTKLVSKPYAAKHMLAEVESLLSSAV